MRPKASFYEREVIHDFHHFRVILLYNQGLGKGCQAYSEKPTLYKVSFKGNDLKFSPDSWRLNKSGVNGFLIYIDYLLDKVNGCALEVVAFATKFKIAVPVGFRVI